ncbi:hypothetical protein EON83_27110 [bacterium]|nr:MAG: hypothetical protein EON83_27110 [bacterium]
MDTSQFDNRIQTAETNIASRQEQMETISQEFMRQAPISAVEFCKKHVKDLVDSNPDAVVKLGANGVQDLKAELKKFYEDLTENITSQLKQDVYWPHRSSDVGARNTWDWSGGALIQNGGTSTAIGRAMLPMLQILSKAGLSNSATKDTVEYYKLPPELTEIGKQYATLLRETTMLRVEIKQAQSERTRAIAESLWGED